MSNQSNLSKENEDKIQAALAEVRHVLNERLGDKKYAYYMNIVWAENEEAPPLSISTLSKPAPPPEVVGEEEDFWFMVLTESINKDLFINQVILFDVVDKVLSSKEHRHDRVISQIDINPNKSSVN